MAKRVRKNYKKKTETGKPVKLSLELAAHLDPLRVGRESYDSIIRRYFGLPSRTGHEQPLRNYYIIDTPKQLIVSRTLAEAKGEVILLAVKRGQKLSHKQKIESVIHVRELP